MPPVRRTSSARATNTTPLTEIDGNTPPDTGLLTLGPRRKGKPSHRLVHHGRHFARTVHSFCNISAILDVGILQEGPVPVPLTPQGCREYSLFQVMVATIPDFHADLLDNQSDGDWVQNMAALIQKGMCQARSDDTKSMKGPILDWIAPPGESLKPPIPRNVKSTRGFHHPRTGALLCPIGLDWSDSDVRAKLASGEMTVPGDYWPIFLYADDKFDPENPTKGLLRSKLLVTAFKHVFTSPSSVDREAKATRSGNARIHGMRKVTTGSLAYIATQVRFALSSASTFIRGDETLDSERFFSSIVDHLNHPDERQETEQLLQWWNLQVFPGWDFDPKPVSTYNALSKIRELRARQKAAREAGLQS